MPESKAEEIYQQYKIAKKRAVLRRKKTQLLKEEAEEAEADKDIKITEERDDKMKVLVYNVEELEDGKENKELEAPIAGGQMVDAFSADHLESEIMSEDLSISDID